MRIGEFNLDCSNCTLTAYCGSSKPPQLCTITALQNVNDVFYRKLAEGLSAADIEHKLRQYDMVQESQETEKRNAFGQSAMSSWTKCICDFARYRKELTGAALLKQPPQKMFKN